MKITKDETIKQLRETNSKLVDRIMAYRNTHDQYRELITDQTILLSQYRKKDKGLRKKLFELTNLKK